MIYYQSKHLADKLDINISKWKRWVREFLPPDALGGFQSGYARQFSLKDAFRVFLGGVLVGSLKFSIPEAKRILNDLHSWIKDRGFYSLRVLDSERLRHDQRYFRIYIYPLSARKFGYAIRSIGSGASEGEEEHVERYQISLLSIDYDPIARNEVETAQVLGISRLYTRFLQRLSE
jgi:hypothetical protein